MFSMVKNNNSQSFQLEASTYLSFESFIDRHLGSSNKDLQKMLSVVGYDTIDSLIDFVVPSNIRFNGDLNIPEGCSETEIISHLKNLASKNKIYKSYIGMGFQESITPSVILRNILENPGWYTAYTPYQAEIAQGRLEALLNYQTMIMDLTGMDISNASLLDESTAAAEAVTMLYNLRENEASNKILISDKCHPQTIDVVKTRAIPLNIAVEIGDWSKIPLTDQYFCCLLQYPETDGNIPDYVSLVERCQSLKIKTVFAADLMSLVLLNPPGEFGADVVVGSSQRFGLPLGYGGPHAGFFATKDEYKRHMPGRLVGVSKDRLGNPALRLSLQTREQHIRRDKATSNICTAQVLLAVLSSMYAVYHGPVGLKKIAMRIHSLTNILAEGIKKSGHELVNKYFFDTLKIKLSGIDSKKINHLALENEINLRIFSNDEIGVSINESTTIEEIDTLLKIFSVDKGKEFSARDLMYVKSSLEPKHFRNSEILPQKVFNSFHTETEMLRYIHKLESKDLSLNTAMIPLGSCTMKLNSTTEMIPVTWLEFGSIHPFAPKDQAKGYQEIFQDLELWLCEITGFAKVSLQPNAGSQGEYAGLLTIRTYDIQRGQSNRNICLIPVSAHGTNPASAVMAGYKVVVVNCDENGNVDLDDLKKKAEHHKNELGALMVTYPSTHGVFEVQIKEICEIIHSYGAHVYMDGANLNAQVGLCRPAEIGADVCHMNLHKTFCIPHGGGGPGVGPIGVVSHLAPFLPGHALIENGSGNNHGAITSAPYGSASILLISYSYIKMLGQAGLTQATKVAILNANYIAKRLENYFPVLYKGASGLVAHECILDFRKFKLSANIEVEDIAKRLMDYGFHAPTMSWPVPGTLMVEPTESESILELDRFCEAMISIHNEIQEIEKGILDKIDNPLKNSPHTAAMVTSSEWKSAYSREKAVYPGEDSKLFKFWPMVARIDNVYGDRNLVCSCEPLESYL
jgi:glycine dehydrogenase